MKSFGFFVFVLVLLFSVSISQKSWSYSSGQLFAKYAFITYAFKSEISNWSCLLCKSSDVSSFKVTFVSQTYTNFLGADDQFYIGYDPVKQFSIIAFRGTDFSNGNFNNAYSDLLFLPQKLGSPYPDNTYVHAGFWNSWKSLRTTVLQKISELPSTYPIVVVGHSYGGALATLASLELAIGDYDSIYSWTFGSPRVGNQEYVDYYVQLLGSGNTFRSVNYRDPVPQLPPQNPIPDFLPPDIFPDIFQDIFDDLEDIAPIAGDPVHVPTEYWFESDKTVYSNVSSLWVPCPSDSQNQEPTNCAEGLTFDLLSIARSDLDYHFWYYGVSRHGDKPTASASSISVSFCLILLIAALFILQ